MPSNKHKTTNPEMKPSAVEAAENLTDSLDENTEALHRVTNRYRWNTVLTALLVLSLLFIGKVHYDGAVKRCEAVNEVRTEIDGKWQAVSKFIEDSGMAEGAGGEAFLTLLEEDLLQPDCSSINIFGQ